jgi:hypothetical protein
MIGATAEQSKTLVRIFERHVRDPEHGDFKNLGFLDWVKRDVVRSHAMDCLLATVPGMTIGIEVDGYSHT